MGVEGAIAARDEVSQNPVDGSEGAHLTLTPSVLWSPGTDVLVHATVRVPVFDNRSDVDLGAAFMTGVALDL